MLALAQGWPGMMAMLRGGLALSLLLSFIHLMQIYMFTIALAMRIPFFESATARPSRYALTRVCQQT